MVENLSAKYYDKERQQKSTWNISVFFRKNKKKSDNIVVNNTKNFEKMKNKSLLSIEKNIMKWENTFYYNYKKLLLFLEKVIIYKILLVKNRLKLNIKIFWKTSFKNHISSYKFISKS